MVFQFFAEGIGQTSKPTHGHTHGQVGALYVGRTDMFHIGIAFNCGLLRAVESSGAVAPLRANGLAVNLYKLRIIYISAKSALNSLKVRLMAVRGQLYAVGEAAAQIVHNIDRGFTRTVADVIRNHQ